MKLSLLLPLFMVALAPWSIAKSASFDAMLHFSQRATLSVPVSGIIDKINIAVGQRVSIDEVLLSLNPTRFAAAVIRAEAEVKIKTSNQLESTRDFEHAQELYDRAVLSNVELENAKLKYNRSVAELEATQAKLSQAKYDLEHSTIAAPFEAWAIVPPLSKQITLALSGESVCS